MRLRPISILTLHPSHGIVERAHPSDQCTSPRFLHPFFFLAPLIYFFPSSLFRDITPPVPTSTSLFLRLYIAPSCAEVILSLFPLRCLLLHHRYHPFSCTLTHIRRCHEHSFRPARILSAYQQRHLRHLCGRVCGIVEKETRRGQS